MRPVKPKEKYHSLEKLKSLPEELEENKEDRCRKNMIHTEQISASMRLNLLLQQSDHSYSKRDIVLRVSKPSPLLSHRVYEASLELSASKENILPSLPTRKSHKPTTDSPVKPVNKILKKTRTYWNKVK